MTRDAEIKTEEYDLICIELKMSSPIEKYGLKSYKWMMMMMMAMCK